jgi:hypothetical protein
MGTSRMAGGMAQAPRVNYFILFFLIGKEKWSGARTDFYKNYEG